MWSSAYYFEVTVHQILAELCLFERFSKLFAAYCLEVIVCKFYFIIGVFFANNKLWPYGHVIYYFFLNLLFFSSPELCSGWAIVITFRPPSVRPSVNIFKRLLLWSRWANFAQISYEASLGWGNERLLKWSRSVNQDGRHAHMVKTFKKIFFSITEDALGLNLCTNHRGREVNQSC